MTNTTSTSSQPRARASAALIGSGCTTEFRERVGSGVGMKSSGVNEPGRGNGSARTMRILLSWRARASMHSQYWGAFADGTFGCTAESRGPRASVGIVPDGRLGMIEGGCGRLIDAPPHARILREAGRPLWPGAASSRPGSARLRATRRTSARAGTEGAVFGPLRARFREFFAAVRSRTGCRGSTADAAETSEVWGDRGNWGRRPVLRPRGS